MRRGFSILQVEFAMLRHDTGLFVLTIAMPLITMLFLRGMYRFALVHEGFAKANGSEQAVPGMAVLFAFFLIGTVGFSFFRDYHWGTWERLRATPAHPAEIMIGKVGPLLVVAVLQQAVLFAAGVGVLGLHIRGSILALGAVAIAFSCCLITLGLAAVAIARGPETVEILANAGSVLFGAIGGAVVPFAFLPGWAQAISPVAPTYWAMKAYRSIILSGTGFVGIALPLMILLSLSVCFILVALLRFRFEETKASFA